VDVRANVPIDPGGSRQHRHARMAAALAAELHRQPGRRRCRDVDWVQDGWTDLARRIRERSASCRREQRTPQGMLAAFEDADFEKMSEIRARVDALVHDADTASKLKAWYRQLCKRPCFHDAYLQAFNQPRTHLLDTDGRGVERITERGVVVAGVEHPSTASSTRRVSRSAPPTHDAPVSTRSGATA
jgi:cation diffusion facilitator CzcD-associated flavoprotein CzcO